MNQCGFTPDEIQWDVMGMLRKSADQTHMYPARVTLCQQALTNQGRFLLDIPEFLRFVFFSLRHQVANVHTVAPLCMRTYSSLIFCVVVSFKQSFKIM